MEIVIGVLIVAVVYLIIAVYKVKKDLKERTSLFIEEGSVGEKIIRNAKGEIILEL